jgi:hypothetical protein
MAQPTGSTKPAVFTGYGGRRPFALATETLAVFRGRVQFARNGAYSVLKTKTATIRVWWAGAILPPDIYVGDMVCVVGKIVTYDNGRDWRITDALPLNVGGAPWGEMMEPIFRRLFMFAGDPAEWCPKEVIDMYRKRRGWKKSRPIRPNTP